MKHKPANSVTNLSNREEGTENNELFTVFKGLSFLFLLYVLPIILSDVLYKDDIRRILYGDPSTWYRDGRPLMAYILTSLSFGTPVFDTAPLPLVGGILFLAFSLTRFYKKYLQSYDSFSVVLCLLMLIISPFFLENLSFKFESLGMCISLGLFILLFSLPDSVNKSLRFALSLIITVCVSCIYQATLGAFFSLLFITVFLEVKEQPLTTILENAFYKIVGFSLGFLLYMARIVPTYVAKDGYQAEHSGLLSLNSEGISRVFRHLNGFLLDLKLFYFPGNNQFLFFLSVVILTLAAVAVVMYIKDLLATEKDNSKYGKALLCFLAPLFILISAFLPMCFLARPNYVPRSFISFTVFLLFIGLLFLTLTKKTRLVLFIFIPVYLFSYGFSYSYGNLLQSQTNYENHVARSIVYDLNKIKSIDGSCKFHIEGKSSAAKDVVLATKTYPRIYSLLITNYLQKNNVYTTHLLSQFSTYRIDINTLKKYNPNDYKVVTKNSLYRILQNKKDVVIEFADK